jgi:hypothetical protein
MSEVAAPSAPGRFVSAQHVWAYGERLADEADPAQSALLEALLAHEVDRYGACYEQLRVLQCFLRALRGRITAQRLRSARLSGRDPALERLERTAALFLAHTARIRRELRPPPARG